MMTRSAVDSQIRCTKSTGGDVSTFCRCKAPRTSGCRPRHRSTRLHEAATISAGPLRPRLQGRYLAEKRVPITLVNGHQKIPVLGQAGIF